MQTRYTTIVLSRSPRGAVKGALYEGDVRVATFSKPALGWYFTTTKFGSDAAKYRFSSFCDSLSIGETLEALTDAINA